MKSIWMGIVFCLLTWTLIYLVATMSPWFLLPMMAVGAIGGYLFHDAEWNLPDGRMH